MQGEEDRRSRGHQKTEKERDGQEESSHPYQSRKECTGSWEQMDC